MPPRELPHGKGCHCTTCIGRERGRARVATSRQLALLVARKPGAEPTTVRRSRIEKSAAAAAATAREIDATDIALAAQRAADTRALADVRSARFGQLVREGWEMEAAFDQVDSEYPDDHEPEGDPTP